MNSFLKRRYVDFMRKYNPNTMLLLDPEYMLMSLYSIKEDMWEDNDHDKALYDELNATIQQFHEAGYYQIF